LEEAGIYPRVDRRPKTTTWKCSITITRLKYTAIIKYLKRQHCDCWANTEVLVFNAYLHISL
jgi:hypothetical protein